MNKSFNDFIKVSDLIYFDGPLLSHFISKNGENYLFYWCDVDEKNNRWLIIRTDIQTIQKYIEKQISLKDIISNPLDGFVYVADIDEDIKFNFVRLLLSEEIPQEYIPEDNSFYNFETNEGISLASLSQKYSSGILEIIIKGRDVKYGSIPLNKFSLLLPKIDEVRKEMANKFIKMYKPNISDKEKKMAIINDLKQDTQYEFMFSMAGSIRIILKPIEKQKRIELKDIGRGYADLFAEDFSLLLASGLSRDKILEFSNKYNKKIIKKYNDLIKYLYEEDLSLGVQWCNFNEDINFYTHIKREQTKEILSNLSDIDFDEIENIEMVGKFYSVNIRSGSYSFESIEGDDEKSTGFLDKSLKDKSYGISFNKVYKVIIERKCLEPVGQKKKIKDTIIWLKEESE